ncbi:hypothetical protein BD779DRAFT_655328 [Infundibulicybe gibba]|nr:hypothetical protein BD779DRAFT_655328 [Infundibulicybe gibba]
MPHHLRLAVAILSMLNLSPKSPPISIHTFIDLILPGLHRCRKLDYRNITGLEFRQLLLLPAGHSSTWKVFNYMEGRGHKLISVARVTVFRGCPKLRCVKFSINTNVQISLDLRRLKFELALETAFSPGYLV